MKRSLWARLIVLRWVKLLVLFIVVAPLAILFFGGIVMWLWNKALAPVLHISAITFWQGLGILVLAKILFGSFGGGNGPRRNYWKEKMMWKNMTAEQREKFKEELNKNIKSMYGKTTDTDSFNQVFPNYNAFLEKVMSGLMPEKPKTANKQEAAVKATSK